MEDYILDVIRGRRKAPWLTPLLLMLSCIYRALLMLRNKAYDVGLFSSHSVSVPVISIGNIVVGGTGKTPVTQILTLALQEKIQPAILTRGFRSQMDKHRRMGCISKGSGPLVSAEECGDEPYLLAKKTHALIWVGSDRVKSAKAAIAEGAECLVLDDGMQHRRIARDVEIVVIDAQDPLSQGRFLPRGLLRDSPERLQGADLIVMTHCHTLIELERAMAQIAPYTEAPVVGVKVSVRNQQAFSPAKVGVFCGIGTPERFLQTVRDLNQEIIDTFLLKDHCAASEEALRKFTEKCRSQGAEAILCTEKDAVKLPPVANALTLKITPVEMELEFVSGKEHWEKMIRTVLHKVGK